MPRKSLRRKLPLGGILGYPVPPKVSVRRNRIRDDTSVFAHVPDANENGGLPTATFCFKQCRAVSPRSVSRPQRHR